MTKSQEFDKLLRMVQRQQNVGEPLSPFFIRTTTELEASVNDSQAKDVKKKMNATNARALTAMKQKVKKTLKDFEKEVKQYQAVRYAMDAVFRFPLDFSSPRTLKLSNVNISQRLLQRLRPKPKLVKSKGLGAKMTTPSIQWERVGRLFCLPLKASSRSCSAFKRRGERR